MKRGRAVSGRWWSEGKSRFSGEGRKRAEEIFRKIYYIVGYASKRWGRRKVCRPGRAVLARVSYEWSGGAYRGSVQHCNIGIGSIHVCTRTRSQLMMESRAHKVIDKTTNPDGSSADRGPSLIPIYFLFLFIHFASAPSPPLPFPDSSPRLPRPAYSRRYRSHRRQRLLPLSISENQKANSDSVSRIIIMTSSSLPLYNINNNSSNNSNSTPTYVCYRDPSGLNP